MNQISNNNGRILEPDLRDLLVSLKREISLEMNCVALGTIQTFYSSSQTADIKLNYKRLYKAVAQVTNTPGQAQDLIVEYPVLINCPVVTLHGGEGYLSFPIIGGDNCIIFFNDRDIDTWFTTGDTTQVPNSERIHNISDGIALVGLFSLANSLTSYKTDGVRLAFDNCLLEMDTLIKIAVGAQTLKDALDSLCTALVNWVDTSGDSPNGATISAINSAKAKIDAVLK